MNAPAAANLADVWTIRWQDSARAISDELWARCFPPPLEGKWWYEALEDSGLQNQFEFRYALLAKNGVECGIAPAFVCNVPIDLVAPPTLANILQAAGGVLKRLRYQRTFFIGSPCADEGTLGLIDPVDLPAAVAAVQRAAEAQTKQAKASILVWKDFPQSTDAVFAEWVLSRRLFRVTSYPGTRVDLAVTTDGYFKSLSGSHRHNLKKKLRRSHQSGELEVAVVRQLDERALDEVFALFWQTYEKGKTKFEVLNRHFFRNIERFAEAHFVLLRDPQTARLAAFMLCFKIGDRAINKFIGLDYQNYGGNWFLYFRLWEAAVAWATSVGATEFQSGQTGYSAKILVGHSLVPLTNYGRHRNPLLHRLFARIARGISWSSLDDDLKTYLAAHPEAAPNSSGDAR